jgi:hypothetical protein
MFCAATTKITDKKKERLSPGVCSNQSTPQRISRDIIEKFYRSDEKIRNLREEILRSM